MHPDHDGCDESVPQKGGQIYFLCRRKIVDGTKCKIHCAAAVAKRRAASDARYEAKMKPKYLAWANQYIGAKVRELVENDLNGADIPLAELAEIIRKADEK